MAKRAKKIKYRNSQLPEDLGAILSNADENDLKILIALMMAADENGEIPEEFSVSKALGVERADVTASVKFWCGAGIIEGSKSVSTKPRAAAQRSEEKQEEAKATETEKNITTAHRDGALESSDVVSTYGSGELATLFEKRKVSSEFIDEAQRVFGKTFNSYDTGIVVGLIDRLGFEEEAVLAILAYMTRIGKKGLRYTEKVALGFYDDGYTTTKEVVERIAVIERSKDVIFKVKQLYGATNRELSKSEKAMFEKWTQKFGYDIDVIRMAYDITIDLKHEPLPKYTGAILESWYNEGLRTADAVAKYEAAKKENKTGGDKSYDLDDFFRAAIDRSLKDLK